MHDRFIVYEALIHKTKLITKDKDIKDSVVAEIVW